MMRIRSLATSWSKSWTRWNMMDLLIKQKEVVRRTSLMQVIPTRQLLLRLRMLQRRMIRQESMQAVAQSTLLTHKKKSSRCRKWRVGISWARSAQWFSAAAEMTRYTSAEEWGSTMTTKVRLEAATKKMTISWLRAIKSWILQDKTWFRKETSASRTTKAYSTTCWKLRMWQPCTQFAPLWSLMILQRLSLLPNKMKAHIMSKCTT